MVDLATTGCDAQMISVKSEILSAKQVSQENVAISARTQTAEPEKESIGLTAKAFSVLSVKDEGDQVTEHRFRAPIADNQAQTNKDLLDAYFYVEKTEMVTQTTPIVIDDRKVTYATMCTQTEVIVEERDAPAEPEAMQMPIPPTKAAAKYTDATGEEIEVASQVSEPNNEEMYPMFEAPPPQEPEETDDGYVEDWADSALYKFVREQHYDKLVKKGLLEPAKEERPGTPNS